jgi:hypothetical protein
MGMGTPVSPATQQAFPSMYGNPSQSFGGFNQSFGQGFDQGGYQPPQRFSDDYNRFLQSGQPFNQPVMGYNSYGQIFAPPRQQAPSFGGKGGGGSRPQPPTMGGKGGGGFRPQPPSMGGKGGGGFQPGFNQGFGNQFGGGFGNQFGGGFGNQFGGGFGNQFGNQFGGGFGNQFGNQNQFGGFRPERRSRQLGLNQPQTGGVPQDYGFPTQEEKRFGGPGQSLPDFGGYFQPGKGSVPSPLPSESDGFYAGGTRGFYSPGGAGYMPDNQYGDPDLANQDFVGLSPKPMISYSPEEEAEYLRQSPPREVPEFDPNTRFSTQALIPATQNGVSGYYTDGSQRNFVPYSQSGRQGQSMRDLFGPGQQADAQSQLLDSLRNSQSALPPSTSLSGRAPPGMRLDNNAFRNFDFGQGFGMMSFQEGGQVPPDANMEMMIAETADPQAQMAGEYDQLIQMTMQAILGQTENADEVIQMFIEEFGVDAFRQLRDAVLKQQAPGAQTEGMVDGNGGGMDDQVMGMIGNQRPVAVSPGEYIIPADVVSGLGDGSSKAGADILDELNQSVRMARTGTAEQPRPLMETLQQ